MDKSKVTSKRIRQHHIQDKLGNIKRLQEIQAFLNYIAATYPILSSYLMGLHLTIDGWRQKRYSDGWRKDPGNSMNDDKDFDEEGISIFENDGPVDVEIKPR